MSQNRSAAVMHQRIEAPDSLDDFPTPPWATRALLEIIEERFSFDLSIMDAREPCANRGHMVRPLLEQFCSVIPSDVFDYGSGYPLLDYLFPGPMVPAAWTLMNPPFSLAVEFILRSFETPGWVGTAAFVRTGFLESIGRYEDLYRDQPPTLVAQFAERVILHKGVLRDPNEDYWDPEGRNPDTGEKTGAWRRPSTATSYCWLLWIKDVPPQPFHLIAPCRKRLERPGDYNESASSLSDGGHHAIAQ